MRQQGPKCNSCGYRLIIGGIQSAFNRAFAGQQTGLLRMECTRVSSHARHAFLRSAKEAHQRSMRIADPFAFTRAPGQQMKFNRR